MTTNLYVFSMCLMSVVASDITPILNSRYSVVAVNTTTAVPPAYGVITSIPERSRAKISDPTYRRKLSKEFGTDGRIIIRIAVIAPATNSRHFSIPKFKFAIDYAMKSSMLKELLNYCNVNVTVVSYADSNCDTVQAPIRAFNLYWDKKIHALFGPSCDYSLAPVARYARYWNLPVITPGGMAPEFGEDKLDDNAEFPLLVRVGATFNGLARVFHHVQTKVYNWKKTKILYTLDGFPEVTERFCHNAMNAVVKELRVNEREFHFHKFDPIEDGDDYETMLKEEIGGEYASKR